MRALAGSLRREKIMTMALPKPPVKLDHVLDDAGLVRRLATANAPYAPVQRYFANMQEQAALGGPRAKSKVEAKAAVSDAEGILVAPWFRGDWAYDTPSLPGVEALLHNEAFRGAARKVFGGAIVRPQIVYINLNLPVPFYDGSHTDIPAFRGVDRTRYPVWLLVTMGRSGLFERWRIRIATAVSWWFEGEGGEFTYWPDGPDAPPITLPPTSNTAVVGDNDFMFHRVEKVGPEGVDLLEGMTLDSNLGPVNEREWAVTDRDRELSRLPFEDIRISVSWKAQVFEDQAEMRCVDEHLDDIGIEEVFSMLLADLETKGVEANLPDDPLHDPNFVATLSAVYQIKPTVQPARQ